MRKLTYTTDFGGDYCEVSINLLEEAGERILGIRIGPMKTLHLRNDDIDKLHDKLHECMEARETFAKLAAQGMGGWNDQPNLEAAEGEVSIWGVSADEIALLQRLAGGVEILESNWAFRGLWNLDLLEVTAETASDPAAKRYYTISKDGRARLAEQEG